MLKHRFLLPAVCTLLTACSQPVLKNSPTVVTKPSYPPVIPEKFAHLPSEKEITDANPTAVSPNFPTAVTPVMVPVVEITPPVVKIDPAADAISDLVMNAEKHSNAGDLGSASVMLERALRISPRDGQLTFKLAQLRLKQSQPRLAEDLAKKADLLAAGDTALKKQCWLLIAQARRLQQDSSGAEQAQSKADSW